MAGEDEQPSGAARGIARARRIGGSPPPEAAPRPVAADTDAYTAPAPSPEAKSSRAGRNLPAAIAVALGLGAVIVLSLYLYRPSFGFVVGAAVLYGLWEITRAVGTTGVHPSLPPLLVGAAASLVAAWQRGPDGLVVGILLTACAVLVWRLGDGADGYLRDVTAALFVLLYVPLLAGFAILLAVPDDGAARVMAFIATVVCSDTGGYATGVVFGKHPLAPIVSKAKTWEGFAGSVAACSVAGVLFLTLTFHEAWWKGLLFGIAVVVTATVGDLGESLVKRDLGIKDMGRVLPGHGGVMDRLDSLLPCAVVAYLVLSAFAPV
jgi:phosphatidate cytidylyltransferase